MKTIFSLKYLSFLTLIMLLLSCTRSTNSRVKSVDIENQKEIDQNPTKISMTSKITCPKCGFEKMEVMPTDVCLIGYKCKNCAYEMLPKKGDCCVFCTYGSHQCPSVQ